MQLHIGILRRALKAPVHWDGDGFHRRRPPTKPSDVSRKQTRRNWKVGIHEQMDEDCLKDIMQTRNKPTDNLYLLLSYMQGCIFGMTHEVACCITFQRFSVLSLVFTKKI